MSLRAVDSAQVIRALKACPERSEELALSAAKGRRLGKGTSPEGLIASWCRVARASVPSRGHTR
jgi:hypothetical protein